MTRLRLLPAGLCLALASTAFAKVDSDYDKTADFTNRRTYAWKTGSEAGNPLTEQHIREAVDAQLREKGLTRTDGTPDLYVLTHAMQTSEARIDVSSLGYGGYYGWNGWSTWGPATTVQVREIATGTLLVDLLDGASEKLVWRGMATETFSMNPTPSKVNKKVDSVTKKMFRGFPPPPPKKDK